MEKDRQIIVDSIDKMLKHWHKDFHIDSQQSKKDYLHAIGILMKLKQRNPRFHNDYPYEVRKSYVRDYMGLIGKILKMFNLKFRYKPCGYEDSEDIIEFRDFVWRTIYANVFIYHKE